MGTVFRSEGDVTTVIPAPEWISPSHVLDCGNSGTTMRLVAGMIASRPITATLIGDASLTRRPMKRVAEPLRLMGAIIEGDTAPLTIFGNHLNGIDYSLPVASAQIKSAILLASLRASGATTVCEPVKSRDHTERMLTGVGVELRQQDRTVSMRGGQSFDGFEFTVPGDISSAAFFFVASALIPGNLTIANVGVNPSRTGILDVIDQCGIQTEIANLRAEAGEPIANIELQFGKLKKPFEIDAELVPRLIDEIPILAVLATQCEGRSEVRGAKELRVKESDRIQSIADGIRAMGGDIEEYDDGFAIIGPTPLRAARIDSRQDHRIAMAFAIAGLIADGTTEILGVDCVMTSYPNFMREIERVCEF